MQNVLIVEDNKKQLNILAEAIKLEHPTWSISMASDYNTALSFIFASIDKKSYFSLFLLDIQLSANSDDYSGFRLAEYIRKQSAYFTTPLLFLTAIPNELSFALSNFHCYDYIVKPYSSKDVLNRINHMLMTGFLNSDTVEFYDINRVSYRLNLSDIYYIHSKSSSHTIRIHHKKYTITTRQYSMDKIIELLNNDFIRCHRQYIVNKNYITCKDDTFSNIFVNGISIPVGRTYVSNIISLL